MKMKKMIVCVAACVLGAGLANAAHMWEDPGAWAGGVFAYDVQAPRYTAQELSMDLFATFTAAEDKIGDLFETDIHDGKWGGGVGLNYFITREIGIGTDINIVDNGGNFVDAIAGSLILRIPLGNSGVAPYAFGGGGRFTEPEWEWFAHAGVGLEYRWNPMTGIFVDGRYMWADRTFDRLELRGGLRFVF